MRCDADFVDIVNQKEPQFFYQIRLNNIEAVPCDPYRLMYSHNLNSFVCDLKMGDGELRSYSLDDRDSNQAIRLQTIPKVFKA